MQITKIFTFDSAHKLDWYKGKCHDLHGHTYKLEITLEGNIDKNGIVLDFNVLSDAVKANIIEKLDHKYLNDIITNPTAENMVIWIFKQLRLHRSLRLENINIKKIKLYETPTSFVEQTF